MNLTDIDYVNGIPKCIQYKDRADKGDFNNPFYLIINKNQKDIVGSIYEIIGGAWNLRIESYDPETGILTGKPCLCPDYDPMTFMAIPIDEGIKHRYMDAMIGDSIDRLIKLKNYKVDG